MADGIDNERVLVLAPSGRDAALAVRLLERNGFSAEACPRVDELVTGIPTAGCALLTQEALTPAARERIASALSAQPPWSDFPFIVFAPRTGDTIAGEAGAWRALGNVTVLERPTQSRTLLSAVTFALRARRRQYEGKDAIQRRDQFLAMLGHELRNPLGAITLAIEGLNGAAPDDGVKQRSIIARQVKHLSRLVDDLLDVARVTTGKVTLQKHTLDLNEVLQRCLQSAATSARMSTIEIWPHFSAEPILVSGDTVRLEEVFNNLIGNAIRYSPKHRRVDVSSWADDTECVVEVKDTGIGIAPEMLKRVFDLFVQGDVTLDRTHTGLGIGLTLAKSLVEMHGGSLTAQSDGPGRGSTFHVRLPLTTAASSRQTMADEERHSALGLAPQVLLVDDNVDLLEMTKEVLETFGCAVETASDGPSGLARLTSLWPSVAFIDIGLPGLDGYQLASEVRSKDHAQPWLVALTGYGQPEDRERALAAGFDEHLTKPVTALDLKRALEAASEACRRRQENVEGADSSLHY
jgi:signal transduction histidine kinase/ActR/RegA family two-component response regulator